MMNKNYIQVIIKISSSNLLMFQKKFSKKSMVIRWKFPLKLIKKLLFSLKKEY